MLAERAPEEARKLGKRIAFAVISALAVILVRKAVEMVWERVIHEPPPSKARKQEIRERRRRAVT